MTTQPNDEQGRFTAATNPRKVPDNKAPNFIGNMQLPGSQLTQPVSLWVHQTKAGGIVISGNCKESAGQLIAEMAGIQVEPQTGDIPRQLDPKTPELEDYGILLFPNTAKTKTNQPDYYGYCNPGRSRPLHRVSIWARTNANGEVQLQGSVRLNMPKEKEVERAPDDEPEVKRSRSRRM